MRQGESWSVRMMLACRHWTAARQEACWDDLLGSAQRIGDAALEAECLRVDVKTMR